MRLKEVLLKDTLVYGISSNLSILSSIFLTPIYTRFIPISDYGVMDIFNVWSNFIINILPLGITTIMVIVYPEIKNDKEERRKTIGSILFFLAFINLLFFPMAILFKGIFLNEVLGKTTYRENTIFIFVASIIVLSTIHGYIQSLLRIKFKKIHFLLMTMTNFSILSLGGFALVYYYKLGIIGIYYASLAGLMASCSIGLYFVRDELFFYFELKKLISILKVSVHFVSSIFLFGFIEIVGRYYLKRYTSLEDIGIYSIALRIGSIIMVALLAFNMAWYPFINSIKAENNAAATIKKVHDFYIIVCTSMAAVIIMFRKELILFFAPNFKDCFNYIPFILINIIVFQSAGIYTLGIHFVKKTKYITLAAAVTLCVNVVLSFLLTRNFYLYGFIISTIVSSLVYIGIQKYYSQKFYKIDFSYIVIFVCMIPFAFSLLGSVFYWHNGHEFDIVEMLIKLLFLGLGFLPVLFFINKTYTENVQQVKNKIFGILKLN